MTMEEQREDNSGGGSEGRSDEQPRQEATPGAIGPAGAGGPGAPRQWNNDFAGRGPRRRGRRGRGGGGGQRFGAPIPPRAPGAVGPRFASAPNVPPRDDEESSQARELAAYERRQQQGGRSQFRGPGWVAGARPAPSAGAPRGGAFRPGGGVGAGPGYRGGFRGPSAGRPPMPGMRRPRPGTGAQYTEQIRRATSGPRSGAAPSHEAGDPIAGPHAVLEAIRAGRVIKRLFISNERGTQTGAVSELIAEAQQHRIFVRYVDAMEISRLSPIEGHQGVVAIAEGRAGVDLDELLVHLDVLQQPALVLVIDSLQDPQNFGVLLRSAEGTGVDGVVIPKHRAVGLTPAVAKTSAGASEHLMIAEVANLRQAIDALKEKGIWVVATDESGDLLYDEVDYRGPTALVIGGEAEGIRRLVLEGCDQVVRIPMEGQVASLNAAAAGTVVLYEALRQRRRNVPPSDTRTPRRARPEAVTPQEEGMEVLDEADEQELQADLAQGEGGEVVGNSTEDDAEQVDAEEIDEAGDAEEAEEQPAAAKKAPAKRAAAKKTTRVTRKKPAE
jgi:23S rRNA (guanosine2251-2'-O)-methyltransferase